MTRFVALLRAVNVGGTGKLAMTDLKAAAEEAGFREVGTYIASGNCLFTADGGEAALREALQRALERHVGVSIGVLVRTAAELARIVAANPFADRAAARTLVHFLNEAPALDAGATATGRADEEIALGSREIYVHYPAGVGQSKLRIRAASSGTARNMNTVAKLAALAAGQP